MCHCCSSYFHLLTCAQFAEECCLLLCLAQSARGMHLEQALLGQLEWPHSRLLRVAHQKHLARHNRQAEVLLSSSLLGVHWHSTFPCWLQVPPHPWPAGALVRPAGSERLQEAWVVEVGADPSTSAHLLAADAVSCGVGRVKASSSRVFASASQRGCCTCMPARLLA